jgi:uncharacterized membrane protein
MNKAATALSLALLVGFLASCGNFREEKPQHFSLLEVGKAPGFVRLDEQVFSKRCTSCHSTAGGNLGGFNMDTYANVFAKRDRVLFRAVTAKTMPLGGPIPDSEQALIQAWYDAGSPEQDIEINSAAKVPAPAPAPSPEPSAPAPTDPVPTPSDPATVTFAQVQDRIFGAPGSTAFRCTTCHGAASPLVQLDTYDKILPKLDRIRERALVLKTMPPQTPLSEGDQQLLKAWIDQGAKP